VSTAHCTEEERWYSLDLYAVQCGAVCQEALQYSKYCFLAMQLAMLQLPWHKDRGMMLVTTVSGTETNMVRHIRVMVRLAPVAVMACFRGMKCIG